MQIQHYLYFISSRTETEIFIIFIGAYLNVLDSKTDLVMSKTKIIKDFWPEAFYYYYLKAWLICTTNVLISFSIFLQLQWPIESKCSQDCYFMHTGIHQVRILVFDNSLSSVFSAFNGYGMHIRRSAKFLSEFHWLCNN